MDNNQTCEIADLEIDENISTKHPFKVILFNDDWHTFEEVIMQLIKAITCTIEKAKSLTFEIHVKGKAAVYSGSLQTCLKVTNILEEIALHTQIES